MRGPDGHVHGYSGAVLCLTLSCMGAAYGTAQAGLGLCRVGCKNSSVTIKGIIPVAMAGVRAIYGLVLSIIILSGIHTRDYVTYNGFAHLSAGLSCGVAQFVSGITVGVIGESSTHALLSRGTLFSSSVLILIFSEALALYGLICGMIMSQQGQRNLS